MKKILFLLLCTNVLISQQYPHAIKQAYDNTDPWVYHDFDTAMKKSQFEHLIPVTDKIVEINGEVLYAFFKRLYDQYNPSMLMPNEEPKIPKIIHQIWLGSEVPEVFKRYMQSWIDAHLGRGWKYKLWTDADAEKIELQNRHFYNQTDNFGVKSDILRMEILYQYGGVYIDTDFECFKPLDIFHHTYDFYTALQPLDTLFVQLGIALVGSVPGHPILKHCIDTVIDDWHRNGAPQKTGPVHFTRSFYNAAGQDGRKDIAFPSSYFYPLGCREEHVDIDAWIENGAFANHWWSKSWMPKNYRPRKFRTIHNDDSVTSWND